jgi:hypothetical protein
LNIVCRIINVLLVDGGEGCGEGSGMVWGQEGEGHPVKRAVCTVSRKALPLPGSPRSSFNSNLPPLNPLTRLIKIKIIVPL